jgi:putative phosphoesterase
VRVLLLSDTHGSLAAPIAALAHDCDAVVHAGDVGSALVLATLRAACPHVIAIRGNNDVPAKWRRQEGADLRLLKSQADVELPGGVLVAIHGDGFPATQRHMRLRAAFPRARAVVYGHSHRWCIDKDAVPWILNPGAAGRARTFGGPSCLLLTASMRGWKVACMRFPTEQPLAAVQPQPG